MSRELHQLQSWITNQEPNPALLQLQEKISEMPAAEQLHERLKTLHHIYQELFPKRPATKVTENYRGTGATHYEWQDGGGSSAHILISEDNQTLLFTGWDRNSFFNPFDESNDNPQDNELALLGILESFPELKEDHSIASGNEKVIYSTTATVSFDGGTTWLFSEEYLKQVLKTNEDGGFTWCFTPLFGYFTKEEVIDYFYEGGWDYEREEGDLDSIVSEAYDQHYLHLVRTCQGFAPVFETE